MNMANGRNIEKEGRAEEVSQASPSRTVAAAMLIETVQLLRSIQDITVPYIRAGERAKQYLPTDDEGSTPTKGRATLVEKHSPEELRHLLHPDLPAHGLGMNGVLESAQSILQYSVNTWDAGFLDKLYGSTDAAGVAAEQLLAVLNTNVHVYSVSPALTLFEKHTAQALANLLGLCGENAGGVGLPGGAASNFTSMLIARNNMFPGAKVDGMASIGAPLAVFTSTAAHYTISTAAAQLGIGSKHVRAVPTTAGGSMDPAALRDEVELAIAAGQKPFYVCATAGTTVNGAYDSFPEISAVCKEYSLWLHIDGCWGGSAIFSPTHRHLLAGSGLADSISISPHKMLGVPLTCSFLLGADMRQFYYANSLEAGYLFHEPEPRTRSAKDVPLDYLSDVPAWDDVTDLAKFTPQCGRRGDSLKLYLAWRYRGSDGFARNIDAAFAAARRLAAGLSADQRFVVLNGSPPACCQVCFRYVGNTESSDKERNSRVTRGMVAALVRRGWMIDFTTGADGEYMRAVCNRNTSDHVVDALIKALVAAGEEVVASL